MAGEKNPIPVALFAYNRPQHLARILACLRENEIPLLYAFSDGPRDERDAAAVAAVRALVRAIDWAEVRLVERDRNFGCAPNILNGLNEVFARHDRAVIVEDDVLPAQKFYESMLALLDHYATDANVFSVGGYPHLLADALPDYAYDVVFSHRFSCWGWGSWADRWRQLPDQLLPFHNPFERWQDVPRAAGEDLPEAVRLACERPDAYWDIPVAAHCLHRGWLHAWTRHHCTSNIGADSGVHGDARGRRLLRFVGRNERASLARHVVPRRFPPPAPDREANLAVQQYLAAHALAGASWPTAVREGAAAMARRCRDAFGAIGGRSTPDPTEYTAMLGAGSTVPCQVEAYFLALNSVVNEGDRVLDVGFGLGYGLTILSIRAKEVAGVDVDSKVYNHCLATIMGRNPKLASLALYNGYDLDFPDEAFDVVTCVDVLEHVADYHRLLREMLRVARRGVFISTPNRRPECANSDGTPKNYWHRREWSFDELDAILRAHGPLEWHFLNGPFEGPFTMSEAVTSGTLALSPFLRKNPSERRQ